MADGSKGTLVRLAVLVVVLAGVGGFYLFKSSKPPRGGNLERIVEEDSENIISEHKSLDEVKKIFHHDKPEPGLEPDVWLFDFSKVDPDNPAKIEVVVKGGKVIGMREFDPRVPPPKPPTARDPKQPEPEPEPAPEPAPSDSQTPPTSGG